MTEIVAEPFTFKAGDGWELSGDLYRGPDPRLAIMITAGTGFPRRFYRHVAAYLAKRGAVVLTFDYRGIGDSGSDDLKNSGIDYPDWGMLDMPAALEALAKAAPDLPLTHLGHSVGGQFMGFMPNHDRLARNALVCVGSGYWGVHRPSQWPLEFYFWWVLGGFSLRRWGYFNPIALSWEPLPADVFRTWRRWSSRRAYLLPELEEGRWPHQFDKVTAPMASWVFSDDGIATEQAARDVLSWYPKAPANLIKRRPVDYSKHSIGHAGAFRKGFEPVWNELWDWLADGVLPEPKETIQVR